MKILHVIDNLKVGGAQRAISNWVKFDLSNDHEIIALFEEKAVEWGSYNITFLGKSYKNLFSIILKLRKEINKRRPDIVHLHLDGSRFIYALAMIGIRRRHKLIWQEQSGEKLTTYYGKFAGNILILLQNRMSRKVDLVIAVSENIKKLCESRYSANVIKIFNPIDEIQIQTEAAKIITNKPSGINKKKIIVGFVGRLRKIKGLDDFIYLAKKIIEQRQDIQFWIVGDGELYGDLRNLVTNTPNLTESVIFWGMRKDVFAIMDQMDVIIMPSKKEPFGLVAAEALALKKPVIGYNIDGLGEVLTNSPGGVPIPANDIEQMVTLTLKIIDKKIEIPFEQQESIFDAQKIARAFSNAYTQI